MLSEAFWGLKFESVIPFVIRVVQAIGRFTSTMHGRLHLKIDEDTVTIAIKGHCSSCVVYTCPGWCTAEYSSLPRAIEV